MMATIADVVSTIVGVLTILSYMARALNKRK